RKVPPGQTVVTKDWVDSDGRAHSKTFAKLLQPDTIRRQDIVHLPAYKIDQKG
ncbi:unnamed protein product, partial [Choristocarpus tenellus]